ncbi:MAG: hypothetical protein QOH05_2300 [Acetobacteraceae bacterium]|nr:hypothetical protein [Acetobacteraceae bacterium]
MKDVKSVLSRLEPMIIRIDATLTSTLPHLATRAEVGRDIAGLRAEVGRDIAGLRADVGKDISGLRADVGKDISGLRTEVTKDILDLRTEMSVKLADIPTRTYMWGILGVLITAYGAGLAALAVIK